MTLWLVSKAFACERPDVSISRDEEAVGKRYVHPPHSSQEASKAATAASVTPQVEDTL